MKTLTNNQKLHELRKLYKVCISHLRYEKGATKRAAPFGTVMQFKSPLLIDAKGGRTVMKILDKTSGKELAQFVSQCSRKDIFVKEKSMNKVLGLSYYHFIEKPKYEEEAIQSLLIK